MGIDRTKEVGVSDLALALACSYAVAYRKVLLGEVQSRRLPSGRFAIPAEELERLSHRNENGQRRMAATT